jgi:cob(I)alamin adenosyltransferase
MRLTKIYTKIGDKGQTMLADGVKVAKDSLRIEAYGTVDELNSHVGHLRDHLLTVANCQDIVDLLLTIQHLMHDIGGELATPIAKLSTKKQHLVNQKTITQIEDDIDKHNEALSPLSNFILPGGHPIVSLTHICRTVCRRAERRVVTLAHAEEIRPESLIYLNRLSDWFFVVGRVIAKRLGVSEVLWQQLRQD